MKHGRYTSTLTGDPFLYHESIILARILLEKGDYEDIKKTIIENNLFNYSSNTRTPKRISLIYRRLSKLDTGLLEKMVHETSDQSKIILLYALYLDNKLMRDFFNNVLAAKHHNKEYYLYESDILGFFDYVADSEGHYGRRWSHDTETKLVSTIKTILRDVGILEPSGNSLKSVLVNREILSAISLRGHTTFLLALGVLA